MYSTLALKLRIAQTTAITPTTASPHIAHASLGHLTSPFSRWATAYPRAMIKNVVKTSAIRTPCAVTDM